MRKKNLINIVEKLRNSSSENAIQLYSTIHGELTLKSFDDNHITCVLFNPAVDEDDEQRLHYVHFNEFGQMEVVYRDAYVGSYSDEVVLYPSQDDRDWKKFKLEAYADKPSSWEDYVKLKDVPEVSEYNMTVVPELENKIKTLEKLIIIRDFYNGEWKPDYNDNMWKWQIDFAPDDEELRVIGFTKNIRRIFTFRNKMLADKFFTSFKDELESIKDLI